jgi:putative endonuclease
VRLRKFTPGPPREKKRNSRYYGNIGEVFAANLLSKKGFRILEKNFRSRFGEIDIVALKNKRIYFVEVKTRQSFKFGKPEEAVTRSKLEKIRKLAYFYSFSHPTLPKSLRILIVSIELEKSRIRRYRIIEDD